MSYLLLTGCGQGIGFAAASLALQRGFKVVGITRSANTDLHELASNNMNFSCIYHDLAELNSVPYILSDIINEHGYPSSVILNAGIRCRASITASTVEMAEYVLRVNTLSNYCIVKTLANIKDVKKGLTNILCVSSIVGTLAFRDLSLYAMSKSALEAFVRSASLELVDLDIHLNAIAPGFTSSSYFNKFKGASPDLYDWTLSKIPLNRWASCEEIAKVCLFLVSNDNTYMMGETITVDGGWTLT